MKLQNHSDYLRLLKREHKFITRRVIKDGDVLIVIDMQNDFIDRKYHDKKSGKRYKTGLLATHNAKKIVTPISNLVKKFKSIIKDKDDSRECYVVATRDYHAGNHCSFPIFGKHCVMGTAGSDVAREIEQKLVNWKTKKFFKNCNIVFKAFHPKIDSFGAFEYKRKNALKRVCGCTTKRCPVKLTGSVGLPGNKFTRYPKTSQLKRGRNLDKLIQKVSNKKKNTLYICGILGDFCVLDTAINARAKGYKHVVIVVNLIRNLRIKGKNGKVVYTTPPKKYAQLARKHGFKFILSRNILINPS